MSEYASIIRASNKWKGECHTLPSEQQMFSAQQHTFQVLIKMEKDLYKCDGTQGFRDDVTHLLVVMLEIIQHIIVQMTI